MPGRVLVFAWKRDHYEAWYHDRRIITTEATYAAQGMRDVRGLATDHELIFLGDWEENRMWYGGDGMQLAQYLLLRIQREGVRAWEDQGTRETLIAKLTWLVSGEHGPKPEFHTKPPRFASFNPGHTHDCN